MMRLPATPLIAFLFSFCGLAACAAQGISAPQPRLPTSQLIVETANGAVEFMVELADDPIEIQTGMMFREEVGDFEGMLFDMGPGREAMFWMRNTLVPLDIIFIRSDGAIHRIAANARPLSEELIPSYGPVRGVLEIRGGRAAELGIAIGDTVRHPLFGNAP